MKDLNGEKLKIVLLDPDKGIAVKDMHYLQYKALEKAYIGRALDLRNGTVPP